MVLFQLQTRFLLITLAASVVGESLTTYLLSHYAAEYHKVITQPAFFHKVLNGTVKPEQVAYFFEQVRAVDRSSSLRTDSAVSGHHLWSRLYDTMRQWLEPLVQRSDCVDIEQNAFRN